MVQKAISEDILRYQKTLLVWTKNIESETAEKLISPKEISQKKLEQIQKLDAVQRALVDVLSQTPEGVSLAQLPIHLKKRLNFTLNLAELGFGKLKDLILSMSDKIRLENRSHNHPFATLIQKPFVHHSNNSSEDIPMYQPMPPVPQYFGEVYQGPVYPIMPGGNDPNAMNPGYYQPIYAPPPGFQVPQAFGPVPAPPAPQRDGKPRDPRLWSRDKSMLGSIDEIPMNQRNDSYSTIYSINENLNPKNTNISHMGNDSIYVPQPGSLYGSDNNDSGYPYNLNISH